MKVVLGNQGRMPSRGTGGSAGFDLYAAWARVVYPGPPTLIPTEVGFELTPGYTGLIVGRSSMLLRGIITYPGVIDSDYRGEILVALACVGDAPIEISEGERVAQILIVPAWGSGPQERLVQIPSHTPSARAAGGWGSTGV